MKIHPKTKRDTAVLTTFGGVGGVNAPPPVGGLEDVDIVTHPPDDGDVLTWDDTGGPGGDGAWVPEPPGGASSVLPWFDLVNDFGGACDDSTTDDAAWTAALAQAVTDGGLKLRLSGLSKITTAIVLPDVDYGDDEAMTIEIFADYAVPAVPSVIGATPLTTHNGGIRTTSTTTSVITGTSTGGLDNFTNVNLVLRNLVIRTPSNPSITALDLSKIANVELENVQIDAGSLDIAGISSQSTSTSFALKCPIVNNGAKVTLRNVNAIGFYNGIRASEHFSGDGVFVWASRKPWTVAGSWHDMQFNRCGWYHCLQGVEFVAGPYTNPSYFRWTNCNIERAHSGTWVQTGNDIVDASNYGYGDIMWHAVEASVGVVHTFVNGGANVYDLEIGEDPFGGTPFSGDAVDVNISDAGGYFTATEVEGALQESAADIASLQTTVAGLGSSAGGHAHVAGEAHLSNGSATTYTLDQYFEPGSVIAWNTTTLARLGVTETEPDQATVSAAGSSGDVIQFDYAATLT